jgi:hypothetical protein
VAPTGGPSYEPRGGSNKRKIEAFLPVRVVEFQIPPELAAGRTPRLRHHPRRRSPRRQERSPTSARSTAPSRGYGTGLITGVDLGKTSDDGDERRIYYRLTRLGIEGRAGGSGAAAALTRAAQLGGLLSEVVS